MLQSNLRGTLALYFILFVTLMSLIITGPLIPSIGAVLLLAFMAFVWATSRPVTPKTIEKKVVAPSCHFASQRSSPIRPSAFSD